MKGLTLPTSPNANIGPLVESGVTGMMEGDRPTAGSVQNVLWAVGLLAIHVMLTQDKGGLSSKWVVRLLDVKDPCSYRYARVSCYSTVTTARPTKSTTSTPRAPRHCSMFASVEPLNRDQPKMARDDHPNFAKVLGLVPEYIDLTKFVVVSINNQHVLIPEHALPRRVIYNEQGEVVGLDPEKGEFLVNDLTLLEGIEFKKAAASQTSEAVAQAVRDRANATRGTAALVRCDGMILGLRVSLSDGQFLNYLFREPVTGGISSATVQPLVVFFSADLLAMCVVTGNHTEHHHSFTSLD